MTGRALQRIKVDSFVFEPGMIGLNSDVTAVTGGGLVTLVRDAPGAFVDGMAGRTADE